MSDKYDQIIDLQEAAYNRTAVLFIRNNKLVYDNSDGEYGEIEVDLEIVEKAIKEYKNKEKKI